jgi:hypothetical protein
MMTEQEAKDSAVNVLRNKQYFSKTIEDNIDKIVKSVEDYNKSTSKLTTILLWITAVYTIVTTIGVCVALFK